MLKISVVVTFLSLSCITFNSYSDDLNDLLDLDMDSISMLDVTFESASKSSEQLTDIPSSVYLLSNERIIRSGYQSIAQLLSLVPGFYATKENENSWIVSSKGFHDFRYNKMLVMVDGRRVDSPMYGGVYWSDLDYLILDIDRIEVLRGPGGTIWGANSANGVVNIITKSAQDALGTLLTTTVGEKGYYDAAFRHGTQLSETLFSKVFYKHKRSPASLVSNAQFRESDQVELSLEKYYDNQSFVFRAGAEKSGIDYTAYRMNGYDDGYDWLYWEANEYQTTLDSYSYYVQLTHQYDQQNGNTINSNFSIRHDSDDDPFAPGHYKAIDADINYVLSPTNSTKIITGIGGSLLDIDFDYGTQDYSLNSNPDLIRAANNQHINDYNSNIYLQAETWWSTQFKTVFGAKGEYFSQNDTYELSPQFRALYQYNNIHSFWTGIARAVMLPSYLDTDTELTYFEEWEGYIEPTTELANPDLDNESVVTTEIGYRYTPSYKFEIDITAFLSNYENLRGKHDIGYGYESGSEADDLRYYSYLRGSDDSYSAKSYGIEVASHYQITENISSYLSYAYLTIDAKWDGSGNSDGSHASALNVDSQHNLSLQVLWTISDQWQWDFVAKYLNQRLSGEAEYYEFDPSITLDTRIAWQHSKKSPSVEIIAQTITQDDLIDSWTFYENEQRLYARLSYEF